MLHKSLSKHTEDGEAELSDTETLPMKTIRGQGIELNMTEREDREPKKEDMQQIIELMDGFKASKVIG